MKTAMLAAKIGHPVWLTYMDTTEIPTPVASRAASPHWRWVLAILAAVPAIFLLWMILAFGVDLIFWDQWSPNLSGLFIAYHEHRLAIGDFFAPHNEHRMAVPRLIFLLLGLATHGDTRVQMIAQWIAVCMTSAGVFCLIAQTSGRPVGQSLRSCSVWGRYFLCNLLIFTPLQCENALWGLGLANVLPMLFTVATLSVLASSFQQWVKLALAMLCATLAVYSSGNGMLAWILGAAALGWCGSRQELKRKTPLLIAWCCGFLVILVLYFMRFEAAAPIDGTSRKLAGVFEILRYNVVFVGNPFSFCGLIGDVAGAAMVGVVLLGLLVGATLFFLHQWLVKQEVEICRRMLIWLAVAGFAVGSGVMASLFRAQLGLEQANSSRYVSFSLYAVVALINLVPMICAAIGERSTLRAWRLAPPGMAIVLVAMSLLSVPAGIAAAADARAARLTGKGALLMIHLLPENPQLRRFVYPDLNHLRRAAPLLESYGYLRPRLLTSRFVSDIARNDPPGSAPRGVMEKVEMKSLGQITASGYAVHPRSGRAADAVFLTCEDFNRKPVIFIMAEFESASDGVLRPSDRARAMSRWSVQFPADRIPPVLKHTMMAAWALDTQTGAAYKLAGEVAIDQ